MKVPLCARRTYEPRYRKNANVVTVVFAISVVNLGLGFALAMVLDRLGPWSTLAPGRFSRQRTPHAAGAIAFGDDSPLTAEIHEWIRRLRDAEVDPGSAIELLLWIVKLETQSIRTRLIELDRGVVATEPKTIAASWKEELTSLHQQLELWIARAGSQRQQAGSIAALLEELLLDQAFQIRSCLDALAAEADREETAQQLAIAMTAINRLRDQTDAILCQALAAEDRLGSIPDRFRTFGEHNTLTRLGLAALFDQWWADDVERVRLVSLVMLDLDRFEHFTQQIGAWRGDLALHRFGDMLHSLVRKDRGFDRVARFSGQRFVLFMGDTSARNAAKGAERIRQTIEATSFELGEETTELTASLAVIEVGKAEGPGQFIARLEEALDACKKAGRNCAFVDEGGGPEPICLPQYKVKVHLIPLDEAAE